MEGDATTPTMDFPALPRFAEDAALYQERRSTYGASEVIFGNVMAALFPEGLTLTTAEDWTRYGLFHQMISKLSRYTKDFHSPHVDSIRDLRVYAAMLETEDRDHPHVR